ncbi:hypothetical protein Nepgr_018121 [Nepenthes gracilis]|uniref:C2 domain-containing protein n=1 Tax=Nepenthes gracilis TaxID=150966 RepID=A0AAD3SQQ0_NEPGR|nr:hypothetical protein Nepgr_018121 [Nepenthes gracilis]
MDQRLAGLLKIRVRRGIGLAIRDICSSDPYVVVTMGEQKLKTRVIKKNCNPEWNDELTLTVTNPNLPIKLTVFDRDRFSDDDPMGEAEIDIKPYLECVSMDLQDLPPGTAVKKIQPSRDNCLADESKVVWVKKGEMLQDMTLRLKNVERGEVQIQIEWNDLFPANSKASTN